jgi:asparagine synthase (glutamine-hydrolysing)
VKTNIYSTNFYPDLNKELKHSLTVSSLPVLLRYADRNSMAHSREVRLPFLSHKLVEFVFSLPDEFKIRDIWTKAILRYSMKDILPSEICWRKEKVGFEPPKNKNVSESSFDKAVKILIDKGILNPKFVMKEKAWEYVQISLLFS